MKVGKSEVVDGKARESTGEPTWRAEILMPHGTGVNYAGKLRTMCIRGPPRLDKEQAYKDGDALDRVAESGDTKKVKQTANDMLRGGH